MLVGAQFGLLAAIVFMPAGSLWSRGPITLALAGGLVLLGAAAAVLGGISLGSSLTPLPIPRADGELVTKGVYRFIRHPIYAGLLLAALGLTVWGASIVHLVAVGGLAIVLYTKIFYEEKLLSERYPEYRMYTMTTGRLFPRLWATHSLHQTSGDSRGGGEKRWRDEN